MSRPVSRAVLFGVHAYRHLGALDGVRHNTPALTALLTADDVGGLDPAHCVTVPADSAPGVFLDAVQDAADEARDLLLVYYAGHGHFGRDGQSLLLATHASHLQRHHHSVAYDDVRAIVARSRARHKVVVVDCCFSGRALPMDGAEPAPVPADFAIEGACVLASAAATERSLCLPDGSVFTTALADLLTTGLPGEDRTPVLTMGEVYETLVTRLEGRTVEGHAVPRPRMGTRDNGHRIPLAANRAYRPPPAADLAHRRPLTADGAYPQPPSTARPARTPHTAFAPTPHFTGREAELADLEAMAARAPAVCLVHGRGGRGKSELLRAAAARTAHLFPDGCLEIDLRGWAPDETPRDPYAVIAEQLHHLGHPAEDVPADLTARAETWRLFLEDRAVLLVLDNARDTRQLTPLLPGATSRSLVLVSSRSELPDLPRDFTRELGPLSTDECVTVWHKMGVPVTARRLADLATRVHGSPLAVRSLSTRLLRGASPEAVLASLSEPSPYRVFRDLDAAERAAFTSAYDALDPDLRTLIRHAAWHPGPDFGPDSLAAMAGLPEHETEVRLTEVEQLLTLHDGRYAFHDLSLTYARERALRDAPEGEREASRERLFAYLYEGLKEAASTLGSSPDDEPLRHARRWLNDHARELGAAARAAAESGWERAPRFLRRLGKTASLDGLRTEAQDLYELLLARSDAGSLDRAHALHGLGEGHRLQDRLDEAEACYAEALTLYEAHGERYGQAIVLHGVARARLLDDRYEEAIDAFRRSHDLHAELGDSHGRADALDGLGDTYRIQDRYDEAEASQREALALYEALGNRRGQADSLLGIGAVLRFREEYPAAVELFEKARDLYASLGDRSGHANALDDMASVLTAQGRHDESIAAREEILRSFEAMGDQRGQANVIRGIAATLLVQRRGVEARRRFEEAYALYRMLGDRLGQSTALIGMASHHMLEQEWDEATELSEQALVLQRAIKDQSGQATTLHGMAIVHSAHQRYEQAEAASLEAFALYKTLGSTRGQADVACLTAEIAGQRGRHAAAAEGYRTALALYTELGDEENAEECRDGLAALGEP
ncbi:tetratricopeptide repeat protein [Streptomyces sp. NPDC085481]|uniref:caspase, EACC1-associated type n=1 Tax=Streptomyces sp. NPDC085481 TaxID=3365727 RepID=UPI0037D6DC17